MLHGILRTRRHYWNHHIGGFLCSFSKSWYYRQLKRPWIICSEIANILFHLHCLLWGFLVWIAWTPQLGNGWRPWGFFTYTSRPGISRVFAAPATTQDTRSAVRTFQELVQAVQKSIWSLWCFLQLISAVPGSGLVLLFVVWCRQIPCHVTS